MAGIGVALVDVSLTELACVAFSTFTSVLVGTIRTLRSILTRGTGTFINVHLAQVPRKAFGALAVEGIDFVDAFAVVEAGLAGTLIRVDMAEYTLVSWHTDAVKPSNLVQTCGVVVAWIRHAFVDIHLTARSFIPLETLTLERTFGVEAAPAMFTRVGTQGAFINVKVAGRSCVTRGACADCLAIDRVCVTVGAFLTRIADAGVIEVAQQTCASVWTLAKEGGYTVVTGGAMVTSCTGAVIDVLAAVIARPAIDANTVVAAVGVVASPTILTCVGHQLALIHIFSAVLACVVWRALTIVGIDAIHTHATILAVMARAVINVMLTMLTCKAWQAAAVIGGVSLLDAGSSVMTR